MVLIKKQILAVISGITLIILSSCAKLNSSEMFHISKKSSFQFDTIPSGPLDEHKIVAGDRFSFSFSTNNGEKIIFGTSGIANPTNGAQTTNSSATQDYLVQANGDVELPLIGKINVLGMSTRELEVLLANRLSSDYLLPFVQIRVTNQRVVIFPGKNSAQVVNLLNTNTSLVEIIAMASGIREFGLANSIILMRKTQNKRAIYKIDLSTIEGLKQGEMLVQSNDYIYINSKDRRGNEILREITPWLSVFSSSLAIFALIIR